ncbi:MAG: response regulator, partial [bacterium]|nr:response regulator [bacterium]
MSRSTQVLIVDDDSAVSEVLSEIVNTYGYYALVANSAKEAAGILAKERISLIFLDLSMPGITGDEFLGFIRKQGFKVPVVVVSGHVDAEREKSLREAGISGVVKKPFEVAQVVDAMENAFRLRRVE